MDDSFHKKGKSITMDSKKVHALLLAIEKGSLTSAAAELGYTQSGLTHMMNALEEAKSNHNEFLRNYIFNVFFINDIINDLNDNKKGIIKNNKFPLEIEAMKFSIGKEYSEKDLGEDYVHCKILRNNNLVVAQAILTSDSIYFGEVMSGHFADLSKIKMFKKIPLRYLEIKGGDNNCTLNVIDKTNKITQKNIIKMHCLNIENTKTMYNYLNQQILFCQSLEESLFTSFMEDMKRKLHDII